MKMDPITQMKGQKFFEDAFPFAAIFLVGFFVVMTMVNIYRMPLIESLWAYGPPLATAFVWARIKYKKELLLNQEKLASIKKEYPAQRRWLLDDELVLLRCGPKAGALVDAILIFLLFGTLIGPVIWAILTIIFFASTYRYLVMG